MIHLLVKNMARGPNSASVIHRPGNLYGIIRAAKGASQDSHDIIRAALFIRTEGLARRGDKAQ
jgi:hypothetical protein